MTFQQGSSVGYPGILCFKAAGHRKIHLPYPHFRLQKRKALTICSFEAEKEGKAPKMQSLKWQKLSIQTETSLLLQLYVTQNPANKAHAQLPL